jgi:hypothetical protein
MKKEKEYKHGEELRKFWREQKRKYRLKKRGKTIKLIDENGKMVAGVKLVDEIPPIKRERKKQK